MLAAIASAVSGMRAATLRLEASASNVANINVRGRIRSGSTAATGEPRAYQPVSVEQASLAQGGTVAAVRQTTPVWRAAYQPDAALADADGLVAEPNVDLMAEALAQASAEASFLANLKVLHTMQSMVKQLYELTD